MPSEIGEIFTKSRVEGMTYAEIAENMNISTSKVDKSIRQALKLLRDALADYLHIIIFFFFYLTNK